MAYRRRSSSWSRWPTKTPASTKVAVANRHAAETARDGIKLQPVILAGRTIASSFWGKSWCDAMESYGDYANRLPRGRTYVRNGSVADLRVEDGVVRAKVRGSAIYTTTITVKPLSPVVWRGVVDRHAGQVSSLIDLLQGKLPASLLQALADRTSGLFPGPKEIAFECSCPDWATMCKHVAAVLYGVGARLDSDPALFFLLRGVDVAELTARGAAVAFTGGGEDELGGADLGALFGIEMAEVSIPERGVAATAVKAGKAPKPTVTLAAVGAAAEKPKVTGAAKGAVAVRAVKPVKAPKPKVTGAAMGAAKAGKRPTAGGFAAGDGITGLELSRMGIDAATLNDWLLSGALLLGESYGEYWVSARGASLVGGFPIG